MSTVAELEGFEALLKGTSALGGSRAKVAPGPLRPVGTLATASVPARWDERALEGARALCALTAPLWDHLLTKHNRRS